MTKPYEPDDPAMLIGTAVPGGDLDDMAAAVIDEYVRLGLDDAALWTLFRSPVYRLTHAIWRAKGERGVQALIDEARARWAYPRFRTQRGHDA